MSGESSETAGSLRKAAHILGLQEPAAAKRYVRALKRLREILDARPGGLGGL